MKLHVDLETNQCDLVTNDITEISESGNGYLPESSILSPINQFKYSNTVSIHVFNYIRISTPNELYLEIHPHGTVPETQIDTFKHDGYVVYSYIVVPTKEWVDNNPEEVSKYALGVYYSDGAKLYRKYEDTQEEEIQIGELLAITDFVNSTVSRVDSDLVVICNLKNCYLHYCNQILDNKLTICYQKNQDKDLLYKRDLVWMSLNVIDFLSEKQEFMAVQELIERLFKCTGLCISKEVLGNDCGCS